MKSIEYLNTGYFSKTVLDYLSQSEKLNAFYGLFPNLDDFEKQINLKLKEYNSSDKSKRKILVNVLKSQYANCSISDKTAINIDLLLQENSFTITTGHQLNLFTGPLYFLYKIISTINLCEELKIKYPKNNFVPTYWMATEDHDFEEIQFFNFKNKKIIWNKESFSAVGRLDTKGLETVLNEIKKLFGTNKNGIRLLNLFKNAYLKHQNLADATRFLANELFKNYGLVIIDADNPKLKQQFIPFIKDEVLNKTAFTEVTKTNNKLIKDYKIQVNPRKLNLFYLTDKLRERIIFKDNIYKVNNTDITFSKEEIIQKIKNNPEQFSPNVIMRPLYQEVILPNLCYIGGGGELAYWLQLKNYFDSVSITFPILLLRNSALILNKKQELKLSKLNLSVDELFLNQQNLITKKITETSNLDLDFTPQKDALKLQFKNLKELAKKTDKSFLGAVNAQEKKQLNGLANLEKRLLKAEKRKLADISTRIILIQNELFPKQSLQERNVNFSALYIEYGVDLIPFLKDNLKPLDLKFSCLTL